MGFFAWLRQAISDAIVGGVNDGLQRLDEHAAERQKAPALPRFEVGLIEAPTNGKAKKRQKVAR